MKGLVITVGAMLSLAACNREGDEDKLENQIRASLATGGSVQQVELTRRGENDMAGFAVVRDSTGTEFRMSCTAQRAGGRPWRWQCEEPIDQSRIDSTENTIRQLLSAQGTVLGVEMNRADENRMTGYADMRDRNGVLGRFTCMATRDLASREFDIRCAPPTRGAAPNQGASDPGQAGAPDEGGAPAGDGAQ